MKLITDDLEKRFREVGSQEKEPNPIVVAKFFNPSGAGTWYATEYDKESNTCFGYVQLLESEWGYFSIDELKEVKCPPFGLPIERDIYCGEKRISEHCPELAKDINEAKLEQLKNISQKNNKQERDLGR
jgi:hypothetical protein